MSFELFAILAVQACLSNSLSTSTSVTNVLSGINNSPCINGAYAIGWDIAIFLISTFVLSFYLEIEQAGAVGSFFALIAALIFFVPVLNMSANYEYAFLGAMLFFSFLSLIRGIFFPFSRRG